MSRGSKSTMTSFQASYFAAGKERVRRAGAHRAQRALVPRPGKPDGCRCSSAAGRSARLPSCLNWMLHRHDQVARFGDADRHVPAFAQPRAQARRARSATSVTARPVAVPSEGVLFSVSPVAALRCGSRLSSRAAMRLASNFGCGFAGSTFFGGVSAFCCVFGSGFLVSFFIASAIGSIFCSGSLAKACFGSGFGCGSGDRRLRLGLLRLGRFRRLHLIGRSQRSPACSRRSWRSALRPVLLRQPSRPAASASPPSARCGCLA